MEDKTVKSGVEYTRETLGTEPHVPASGNGDNYDVISTSEPLIGRQNYSAGVELRDRSNGDTLFFRDGRRRIDMILVYEDEDEDVRRREKRKMFQDNLQEEGLELEVEPKENSLDGKICFIKVHATWDVLRKNAEMMRLKLPLRVDGSTRKPYSNMCWPFIFKFMDYNTALIPPSPSHYMAPFCREREDQFLMDDRDLVFTPAQRSLIVWQVLRRTKYRNKGKGGILTLLHKNTYSAAYPLHDGGYQQDNLTRPNNERKLLYQEWARASKWYKHQPLFLVKKYFGEKIGLYFAWLGYYTMMLIPASVVGVICFIYGLLSMNSPENISSNEVCNMSGPGNITLCPLCDQVCNYQKLGSSCTMAHVTYLFDNPSTIFFSVFMAFWATTFTEIWKRSQLLIEWDWDIQNLADDEVTRPEFKLKSSRTNPATGEKISYMRSWTKDRVLRYAATGSTILFMLSGMVAAFAGVMIYELSVVSVMHGSQLFFLHNNAKILTAISAAIINLIVIIILKQVYRRVAVWLVEFENHRTESEYNDSFTVKMFVFQFINSYSSILYVAFFKGRSFVYPGHGAARTSLFHQLGNDMCGPAGCFYELCIQLTIIMVGGQTFDNIVEIVGPIVSNWWRKRSQRTESGEQGRGLTRWEEEYHLQEVGRLSLFEEYLEVVLQYGFVTLFVAAFPLAPLFALFNNLIEIRLDAFKIITQQRRPLAIRAQDIGAWNRIIQGLTSAAVIFNALVIAFTSDFIPRLVYISNYSKSHDLTGYIQFSLSEFNTTDYPPHSRSNDSDPPASCWYRGYRNGPDDEDKYGLTLVYWHILAVRFIFVFVFEHVVISLTRVVAYAIPDIPNKIRAEIHREKMIAREVMYSHVRAHGVEGIQ